MASRSSKKRSQRGYDAAGLQKLAEELVSHGFAQTQVAWKLGLSPDATTAYLSQLIGLVVPTAEPTDHPEDTLTQFFIGGATLPHSTLERLLSREALGALESSEMAKRSGRDWIPLAALFPLEGLYLSCDFPWRFVERDYVSFPDGSTAGVVAFAPAAKHADAAALDLGCGSGVVAIYLAARRGFRRVRGIDTNPRALQLAECNAALNGVELELEDGDVTKPSLLGTGADLITFALPQLYTVPRSPSSAQHAPDGDALLWKLLTQLPDALADQGEAVLFHQTRVPTDSLFGTRADDLLQKKKAQLTRLSLWETPAGIEHGLSFIRRDSARHGYRRLVANGANTRAAYERRVESEDIAAAGREAFLAARAERLVAPQVETRLVADPQTQQAKAQLYWYGRVAPPGVFELFSACDGTRTVAELLAPGAGPWDASTLQALLIAGSVALRRS